MNTSGGKCLFASREMKHGEEIFSTSAADGEVRGALRVSQRGQQCSRSLSRIICNGNAVYTVV